MAPVSHLLIDDEEIGTLLSKSLTQHGYRVSVAQDGRAMMQALENGRVSLIVSRLRHKLAADSKELELIETVRSGGYVFATAVTTVGANP